MEVPLLHRQLTLRLLLLLLLQVGAPSARVLQQEVMERKEEVVEAEGMVVTLTEENTRTQGQETQQRGMGRLLTVVQVEEVVRMQPPPRPEDAQARMRV